MKKKLKEDNSKTRIPGTAACSKESTAQRDTAPQRRARHGTARRCAALRSYIYSWADLSWACIVIRHCA